MLFMVFLQHPPRCIVNCEAHVEDLVSAISCFYCGAFHGIPWASRGLFRESDYCSYTAAKLELSSIKAPSCRLTLTTFPWPLFDYTYTISQDDLKSNHEIQLEEPHYFESPAEVRLCLRSHYMTFLLPWAESGLLGNGGRDRKRSTKVEAFVLRNQGYKPFFL